MKFYPIPLPGGKAKVRDADGIDRYDFDTLESAEAWIALEEHKQKWCIDNINRIKGLSYPQIERLYTKENQPEPDFDWAKVFNKAKLTEQQKWDMTTALLYEMIERREPFNRLGANYAKGIKKCDWCGEYICQKPSNTQSHE